MSSDKRDTQFQGFARLLLDELQVITLEEFNNSNWTDVQIKKRIRIARRAYDFARHIMNATTEEMACVMFIDDAMEQIPDMTELPKEDE